MNRYFIELHPVSHEIALYIAEIEQYGEITYHHERYNTEVWIESPWDIDIIEGIYGVKRVRHSKIKEVGTNVQAR